MRDAVLLGLRAHVGHGIKRQRHMKPQLIRLTGRSLHSRAGGDPCQDHLRHPLCPQLRFQSGARKGAPGLFCHKDVRRLLVQLRQQVRKSCPQRGRAIALLRSARSPAVDVDQYDRKLVLAKRIQQLPAAREDPLDGVNQGCFKNPF